MNTPLLSKDIMQHLPADALAELQQSTFSQQVLAVGDVQHLLEDAPVPTELAHGTCHADIPVAVPPPDVTSHAVKPHTAADFIHQEYVDTLRISRSFQSPHCAQAMAEALELQDVYNGLAGSAARSCLSPQLVETQRTILKRHVDAAWSEEALKQGITAAKSGDYQEADRCYTTAIKLNPDNSDAYVARGAAYANQGEYIKADGDFATALQINPGHSNAQIYKAAIQSHLQNVSQLLERQQQQQAAPAAAPTELPGNKDNKEPITEIRPERARTSLGSLSSSSPSTDTAGACAQQLQVQKALDTIMRIRNDDKKKKHRKKKKHKHKSKHKA